MPPEISRQSDTVVMMSGIAAGDMAEQHVGMAVGRLGVGGNDDISAEVERALAEGRHRRVVDDKDRARPVNGFGNRRNVADVQSRIGGGFDEGQAITVEAAIEEGRGRPDIIGDAKRLEEAIGQRPGGVIAIRRQQDAVPGLEQPKKHRRDRGHSGWEGDTWRIFQMRQHMLDRVPCRVAETAVLIEAGSVAWRVKNGGHRQRQGNWIALGKAAAAQMGKCRRACSLFQTSMLFPVQIKMEIGATKAVVFDVSGWLGGHGSDLQADQTG